MEIKSQKEVKGIGVPVEASRSTEADKQMEKGIDAEEEKSHWPGFSGDKMDIVEEDDQMGGNEALHVHTEHEDVEMTEPTGEGSEEETTEHETRTDQEEGSIKKKGPDLTTHGQLEMMKQTNGQTGLNVDINKLIAEYAQASEMTQGAGLENNGVNGVLCFLNATLNLLTQELSNDHQETKETKPQERKLSTRLRETAAFIELAPGQMVIPEDANPLAQWVNEEVKSKDIRTDREGDVGELLHKIFDNLDPDDKLRQRTSIKIVRKTTCAVCEEVQHTLKLAFPNDGPWNRLGTSLPPADIDLGDLLGGYAAPEGDREWRCKKNCTGQKTTTTSVEHLPNVLICILKRTEWKNGAGGRKAQKIHRQVKVPLTLKMGGTEMPGYGKEVEYRLKSGAFHSGTADSGHLFTIWTKGDNLIQKRDDETLVTAYYEKHKVTTLQEATKLFETQSRKTSRYRAETAHVVVYQRTGEETREGTHEIPGGLVNIRSLSAIDPQTDMITHAMVLWQKDIKKTPPIFRTFKYPKQDTEEGREEIARNIAHLLLNIRSGPLRGTARKNTTEIWSSQGLVGRASISYATSLGKRASPIKTITLCDTKGAENLAEQIRDSMKRFAKDKRNGNQLRDLLINNVNKNNSAELNEALCGAYHKEKNSNPRVLKRDTKNKGKKTGREKRNTSLTPGRH
jgi:hypothetical protein